MALPVVNTIQHSEDLIKLKLRGEFDGVNNKNELSVPDLQKGERVETYQTNHAKGALIVHYDGSSFTPVADVAFHADRTQRFVVLVQIKVAEGAVYKNAVIERVMKALAGVQFHTLLNTGRRDRIGIVSDEYLSPEENLRKDAYEFLEHVVVVNVPTEFREDQT